MPDYPVPTLAEAINVEADLYDRAHELAHTDLPDLLHWLSSNPSAPLAVDHTLAHLGLPEPDYLDGRPVAGSLLRKVLHYAHVEHLADLFRGAHEEIAS